MVTNAIKHVYDNNQKIKELENQIKALKTENDKCLEKIYLSGKTKQGKYSVVTKINTRRVPNPALVVKELGMEEALQYASFQIGKLEKVLSKESLDELCDVTETITRQVIMEE